jgi:hypothetical protein
MPQNNKLDPQANLDFTWDFHADGYLADDDPIASYVITAEAGIEYHSDSLHASSTGMEDAAVTAWVRLDGGTVGTRYGITCHIVTAAGREDDRTKYFLIIER